MMHKFSVLIIEDKRDFYKPIPDIFPKKWERIGRITVESDNSRCAASVGVSSAAGKKPVRSF